MKKVLIMAARIILALAAGSAMFKGSGWGLSKIFKEDQPAEAPEATESAPAAEATPTE